MKKKILKRCEWGAENKPLLMKYHDKEWGVPIHNDRKLFEFLVLEGFQAGLNWLIILNKRENFRKAFDDFDFKKISAYGKKDVARLMKNKGIVRNRLKIEAAIINAQKFMEIRKEFGTFDKYIWGFIKGKPIKNKFRTLKQLPASTKISDAISKDLKERGFKFVGSTIIYAHMQATGMVNDHVVDCFRYKQLV